MNAPQHDPRSVDDDPTGMRALLRGLPDPGPMPPQLVDRIQASLAAERTGATVLDLETFRARRRPALRPVHWAAAAGLVAVAGGGLLATGSGGGLLTAFSGGTTSASTLSAGAESVARDSAGGAGIAGGPNTGSSVATGSGGPVAVIMTGASWSGTDLGPAARAALALPAPALPEQAADGPASGGPVGTPAGARECADALGVPTDATVLVDLGSHDGAPAALVVATSTTGAHTAYVVGRDCRHGDPQTRVGPQALAF